MHPEIRPAERGDLKHIAENLTASGRVEMLALGVEDIEAALNQGFDETDKLLAWTIDGQAEALFGVRREGTEGYIWTAHTDAMLRRQLSLHRNIPEIIKEISEGCLTLSNVKYAGSTTAIRWLQHLGFTFINTFPAGPHGFDFHEFVRIQP